MAMATLVTVLIVSLLGSVHCVGMCGPLVAVAVGDSSVRSHRRRLLLQVAYHGCRLPTYTLVGVACGLVGSSIDWGGSLVGIQRMAALLVGAVMVLVGLLGILRYVGVRLPAWPGSQLIQRWVVRGQKTAMQMRPLPRAAVMGSLTALLPCGWLYVFAIAAAGTGSPVWGGAIMATFWAGTVPILALLGISLQTLSATLGRRIPLAISVIVVLLGLFTIGGRLTIPASAFEPPPGMDLQADTLQQVKAIGHTEPPCCQCDEERQQHGG